MKPRRALFAVAAAGFGPCLAAYAGIDDDRTRYSVLISAVVSFFGFLAARAAIPLVKAYTLRAGLSGLDINKKGSKEGEKPVPESLGLASGVVFLVRGPGRGCRPPACVVHVRSPGCRTAPPSLTAAAAARALQVCIVLFQQLHYHDAASFVHWLTNGGSWMDVRSVQVQLASDAWCVVG